MNMMTVWATLLSAVLVLVTLYMHFRVMKYGKQLVFDSDSPARKQVLLTVTVLFMAHIAECFVYAIAFLFMERWGMGDLTGMSSDGLDSLYELFYFSIASYTSLGIGDILPTGEVRLVAGVEALNGLLLIAWSSSYTYFIMERVWGDAVDEAREAREAGKDEG